MADGMIVEEQRVKLLNPDVVMDNPRRKRRRRHYRRPFRNPDYSVLNPVENPSIMDQLANGSDLSQNVSPTDVAFGTTGFLLNNFINRQIGLTGWAGILASAITPFITGAIVGMGHSRWGSAVFFGGALDAALKITGKTPGLQWFGGLKESGNGSYILEAVPAINVSQMLPTMHSFPAPAPALPAPAPAAPAAAWPAYGMGGSTGGYSSGYSSGKMRM